MNKKIILSCNAITYDPGRTGICEFSCDLYAGERMWVQCHDPEQQTVLWRILLGKLKPSTGGTTLGRKVLPYSDELLKEKVHRANTIKDNLKSRLFEDRCWINGRRMHQYTMMERLDLSLGSQRVPIRLLSTERYNKFWTLMVVICRSQLMLGHALFEQLDEESAALVQDWLVDYNGAFIYFGDKPAFQTDFDHHFILDEKGVQHRVEEQC